MFCGCELCSVCRHLCVHHSFGWFLAGIVDIFWVALDHLGFVNMHKCYWLQRTMPRRTVIVDGPLFRKLPVAYTPFEDPIFVRNAAGRIVGLHEDRAAADCRNW